MRKIMDMPPLEMAGNLREERTVEREAQRMQTYLRELVERIGQAVHADGSIEPLPGLHLTRTSARRTPVHSVVGPSLCVVAQGSKEFLLGASRYRYDPLHYLLVTVDLPYAGQVIEASLEQPFLGLRLELAPDVVSAVMLETGHTSPLPETTPVRAIAVSQVDVDLLDVAVRLVRLLDAPAGAAVLMPLIMREIVYRLLIGEQGSRLRQVAVLGGYTSRIARAIERLSHDFDQPLRIESLAFELGMSVSSLQHHFKAVTAMSPSQYQKRLRLLEARRLLLGEDLDAAGAAHRVGYYDASHFNREYKSLFGVPPIRDVHRMRAAARGLL